MFLHLRREGDQAEMLQLQRGDWPFNISSSPTDKIWGGTEKEVIEGGHEIILSVFCVCFCFYKEQFYYKCQVGD